MVELLGAAPRVPVRLEIGKYFRDLTAIHPVAALVRSGTLRVLDSAIRHNFPDDLGELAHPVVLFRDTHVESLAVHNLARSFERGDERPRDILDVNDGPPGRPITFDKHATGGHSPTHKIVQHKVGA